MRTKEISSKLNLPPNPKIYDMEMWGTYGEFGSGGHVKPFFLQSAISVDRLQMIKLVNEIDGTERWPIQDLFQRDVDVGRVVGEIMPYFKNQETVNFFGPLVLTLMPFKDGCVIQEKLPRAEDGKLRQDNRDWETITRGDHYRIRIMQDGNKFAVLEWNSSNTEVVAIDGQHRLSTLKRLIAEGKDCAIPDIHNWRIPVLVASFRAANKDTDPPGVVEVSRQLFTNINTEARTVSLARQILLNDRRINSIFTQEIIQRSHANDLKPSKQRDESVLPLLFFDWRSDYEGDTDSENTLGLKSVVEVHAWSENYLFGKGEIEWEMVEKHVKKTNDAYTKPTQIKNNAIPLGNHIEFRLNIQQHFIPALAYLLENFEPYERFISSLRGYELKKTTSEVSEAAKHAFDELRYGRNFSLRIQRPDIEREIADVEKKILEMKKDHIPYLFERAIGMRGVVCSYATLGERGNCTFSLEYSKDFTRLLNMANRDGWFDPKDASKGKFIYCVAVDMNNKNIINFKHHSVRTALGNYISLVISVYALERAEFEWLLDFDLWKTLLDNYRRTVFREYKKEARFVVKDIKKYEFSPKKEIEQEIEKRARGATRQRLKELVAEFEKISDFFVEVYDEAELQNVVNS